MNLCKLGSCFFFAQCGMSASVFAGNSRDLPFDGDWRFLRADEPGMESPSFDDSNWRQLDLPHDWTIEDLPIKENAVPELEAVTGQWRFHKGDDAGWSASELDDSDWQLVALPDNWEHHSDYTDDNVYGWFRRKLEVPEECQGQNFDLLLGCIDDVDEAWLNGQRIGGMGVFPPNYSTAWDVQRRYRVPASLVRGDGTDILAVRVFDGNGNGGINVAGIKDAGIGPFDPMDSPSKHFTGNTIGGIGCYRKHFVVNETDQRVAVRFDGVYMNAEVFINGQRAGEHPHGYTAFEFDLTPHLKAPGEENILAVRVRNEGRNSRWYSGSGIYRHVWLTITNPVHVPTWGVFVATPEVTTEKATVRVAVEARNETDSPADALVRIHLRDFEGKEIGSAESELKVDAGSTGATAQLIEVSSPKLWGIDTPYLYTADVEIVVAGKTVDTISTNFGIRKIEIDAVKGFRLNGEPLLLKGGCIHHDNGPLGSKAIDRAEIRRVELLKANGYNAIRSSHNPPSSAMLDACDRLGMLMIDEAFDQWNQSKEANHQDYHRFFNEWCERDIASMVRRDRNHPCIIMWSIGNEIPEQFNAESTQKRLREAVLSHDPTRHITQAISRTGDWAQTSDPAFTYLDVCGYNYLPDQYESDHARHPDRVMLCTESYPKETFLYWSFVEKHSYIIGDFVWTAMDYLGEAGLAHAILNVESNFFFMPWPWIGAWCGDLDLCGLKKPQSYYRDVVWGRSQIEMAVHTPIPSGQHEVISDWGWPDEERSWNWPGQESNPLQVSVYSSCEKVRLELNGEVIGEQPVSAATNLTAKFDVPYTPGELKAYGLDNGKVVAETALKTSGAPKQLKLTADRTSIHADRNDLSYVTVEVVDADGARVPNAEVEVHFAVSGAGELAAQCNGSPNEPASFQAPVCKTRQGRCLAILRPTGKAGAITLHARAEGLKPETITIQLTQGEGQ
ncbi:DUF4982 domain-containing protein [Candidatus Sumerlaeota bacterium]|nr:DUF4982 domain-containing protein [Candidatus Sumerlaeota bacterium]